MYAARMRKVVDAANSFLPACAAARPLRWTASLSLDGPPARLRSSALAANGVAARVGTNFRPRQLATLLITLVLLVPASASAVDGKTIKPKAGTPHHALLDGLKLIRDSKFDAWIERYCHTEDLCFSETSKRSLRKYNLPAIHRLASHCIKGGDALKITRTDGDPAKDDQVKLFVECNPKGMPRPFTLKRQGKAWKFKKL